jgi:predicted metal-dependent hydrolase/CheY-like chemotaxis protein
MSMDEDPPQDVIMAWSQDLFLAPRLQDVARGLGYAISLIEKPSQLGAQGEAPQRAISLTEPLEGPDAHMVATLTEHRPALILVDTTAQNIPWARWIQVLKTSAATRRIPIVAFGPHVDEGVLDRARSAGADQVVTRGKLQSRLPKLIQEWAQVNLRDDLAAACEGALSAAARQGVAHHLAGEYFEAHEALEAAWKEAPEAEGYLYRALLQVSVAYYHIQRHNHRGATKMMLRIRQWLDPLPDACRGIDVAALRGQVDELRAALGAITPESIDQLDRRLLRPFPLVGE